MARDFYISMLFDLVPNIYIVIIISDFAQSNCSMAFIPISTMLLINLIFAVICTLLAVWQYLAIFTCKPIINIIYNTYIITCYKFTTICWFIVLISLIFIKLHDTLSIWNCISHQSRTYLQIYIPLKVLMFIFVLLVTKKPQPPENDYPRDMNQPLIQV